jgi:SAM-dependent methyltransferase
MTASDPVKAEVLQMYMRYPYPNYSAEERAQILPAEQCRYRYLGLEALMANARVLDVGCGTAHRVMPLAKHYGAREYVGLEQSAASIAVARELAARPVTTSNVAFLWRIGSTVHGRSPR